MGRHDACQSLYWRSKARLPTGHPSWPTRRGTCPITVLRARGGRLVAPNEPARLQAYARVFQARQDGTGWTPPDGI